MTDTPTTTIEQLGEVVVLCMPTESAWSARDEARKAAKNAGGVIDFGIPARVMHEGEINGIDLQAAGLKAVIWTMKPGLK